MSLKFKNQNIWLDHTGQIVLFFDPKNIITTTFVEETFSISIGDRFVFINDNKGITFLTEQEIEQEIGEINIPMFFIEDDLLMTMIDNKKYVFSYENDEFIFVEFKKKKNYYKIEIVDRDISYVNENVFLCQDDIIQQKNESNCSITVRDLTKYQRNKEDDEYKIIKHILLNDRNIIPKIFFLNKKYYSMELYDGDLGQIKLYDDHFIHKKKRFEWTNKKSLRVYLLEKIKDLQDRLFNLGIYHGDFFPRNIVFKYIDDETVDLKIIDFDLASYLSENLLNIFLSIKEENEYINISTIEELEEFVFENFLEEFNLRFCDFRFCD